MAYLATVSIQEFRGPGGRETVTIKVVETQARDTSEWSTVAGAANPITLNGSALVVGAKYPLPPVGSIVLVQAVKTAGTGTTIQPRFGKATGWSDSTMAAIAGLGSAAAYQNTSVPANYAYDPGTSPVLYGRSTPNDTTPDHTITTLIVLEVL